MVVRWIRIDTRETGCFNSHLHGIMSRQSCLSHPFDRATQKYVPCSCVFPSPLAGRSGELVCATATDNNRVRFTVINVFVYFVFYA